MNIHTDVMKMVSNIKLAEMFANGETKGKGSNMFIEGDTIYSYGYHFPIAKRYGKHGIDYLFNGEKYSNSTDKQQSYVLREIYNKTIVYLSKINYKKISYQEEKNLQEIETLNEKIKRARKQSVKDGYECLIKFLEEQNKKLENLKKQGDMNGNI